jgi:hypothetical protein
MQQTATSTKIAIETCRRGEEENENNHGDEEGTSNCPSAAAVYKPMTIRVHAWGFELDMEGRKGKRQKQEFAPAHHDPAFDLEFCDALEQKRHRFVAHESRDDPCRLWRPLRLHN